MQGLFSSQLKLASKLRPTGKKIPAMKVNVDLPISAEMVEWLEDSCNRVDDYGYLAEEVSSVLTRPLDSFSTYCPTGAIVTSKFSTSRIPEAVSRHKLTLTTLNSNSQSQTGLDTTSKNITSKSMTFDDPMMRSGTAPSMESTNVNSISVLGASKREPEKLSGPPPQINDVITRLNIMWLQRRAQLEREDGETNKAVSTLEEALQLHLGTTNYADAKLGEPVVSSDPLELLQTLGDNYVVYDSTAHRLATKIQICYHRHYMYRSNAARSVGAFYRGYLVRRDNWRRNQLRTQCAQLLQHRFRVHLARMHRLATMIKRWYKLRKDVKAYQKKLRVYQAATRIQRLFRGMKGRQIANYLRTKLQGAIKVQYNARGYLLRRDRGFAISMYHRMFYRAARRIQCLTRIKAAIRHSQLKLLQEVVREDERIRRERELIHHTIQIEMARMRLYFKTVAGKLHLKEMIKKILVCDKELDKRELQMSHRDKLARRAHAAFELHDLDGSGKLSESELANMMRDLCVPMTRRKISKLSREMDADGSGDIDFGELLDWYCKATEKESLESVAFGTSAIKRLLVGRQLAMKLTGNLVRRRAELEILRQCTTWRSKDAITLFRQNEPPKYQCCQCLKPFVMFTDYYSHFTEEGNCIVLNQKGMYYDRFWIKRDWHCQRQIEKEIIRMNGEVPYVNYFEMMGSFEDLALQRDNEVKNVLRRHMKAANHLLLERFTSQPQLKPSAVMLESISICKSKTISPVLALVIANCIGKPVPTEWLMKNEYTVEKVKPWLVAAVEAPVGALSQLATLSCLEKTIKTQTRNCANLHVKCLRTLQVSLQCSLVALVEYRVQRKRTMTISDKELEFRGLNYLTSKKYFQAKNKILKQLKILQGEFVKLDMVQPPSYCSSLLGPRFARFLPVSPGGEVTPEQLKILALADAHARAKALWRCRLRSEVGRVQRNRLSNEQWAARRLFWINSSRFHPSLSWTSSLLRWLFMNYLIPRGQWAENPSSQWRTHADLEYIFNQYASALPGQDPTVQVADWEQLQIPLALRVKPEDEPYIRATLDPDATTRITFDKLATWLESTSEVERFHSPYRRVMLQFFNFLLTMSNTMYNYHGKIVMHLSYRNLARVELHLLDTCNNVFADIAESLKSAEEEQAAAEQKQIGEGEAPNDDETATEKEKSGKGKGKKSKNGDGKESPDGKKDKKSKDKKSKEKKDGKDVKGEALETDTDQEDKDKTKRKGKDKDKEKEKNKGKDKDKDKDKSSKQKDKDGKDKKDKDKEKGSKKDKKTSSKEKQADDGDEIDKEKADKKVSISAEAILAKQKVIRPPRIMTFDAAEELFDPPDVLLLQKLEAESEVFLEKEVAVLTGVKAASDDAEIQLIFRMEEDAAERKCLWKMFLTRRGRYSLHTEYQLLQYYDSLIEAYGSCMSRRAATPFRIWVRRKYAAIRHMHNDDSIWNTVFWGLDKLLKFKRIENIQQLESVAAGSDDNSSLDSSMISSIDMDPSYMHDKGWNIILALFVYSFDTDCSGTFDEGEVRLLLDSAICHLPERKILATFPEVRLDSSSCERIVDYLADRVHWRRNWFGVPYSSQYYPGALSISRRARILQAALLLISRSRQAARSLTAQAVSLVRTGKLLEQDNSKNESTLIVRSQVLALRQVKMFLTTTCGRWVRKTTEQHVKQLWKSTVMVERSSYSLSSLFLYAIRLHADSAGLLNTELPHLLHYIRTILGFAATSKISAAMDIIEQLSIRKNLNLYSESDLLSLLTTWFAPLQGGRLHWSSIHRMKLSLRSRTADAIIRMNALARQQAVLISMKFKGMAFADTNYRCSVLGLYAVMTEIRYRDMASLFNRNATETIERRWVPKEAIPFLLQSKGYTLGDCFRGDVPSVAGVVHSDGALAAHLVGVKAALQTAAEMSESHSYLQYFDRWGRLFVGLPKFVEYKRVLRAMVNYTDDVNAAGAHFLNEILTGISHCSVDEEA